MKSPEGERDTKIKNQTAEFTEQHQKLFFLQPCLS